MPDTLTSARLSCPDVSVVIPLYNAEKYIAECLDSLLAQTFQNFEVIVVDDCSTDSSPAIVRSYAPKFNGRLTLTYLEENSGSGAMPRNIGLSLSRGEYIQFLDSDDTLTKSALEEMHALAKEYDADVVHCEKYYESDEDGTNIRIKFSKNRSSVDKPTLETTDFNKRILGIINSTYVLMTCSKLVRRNLILENKIFFPPISPSEDNIWAQSLLFYAKKFLRVPNAVYVYRQSKNSSQRTQRTPQQRINFWLNPVLLGLKSLDKMMNGIEFFQKNPQQQYAILEKFVQKRVRLAFQNNEQLKTCDVYSTIKDEFGDKLGDYDVLISALCAALYREKKSHSDDVKELLEFKRKFTARIDIKLVPKDAGGDLKILSVSDNKAEVLQPEWLNQDGVAYVIKSYVGKVKLVVKTEADGQIQLALKGLNFQHPADKNKSIRYLVYYTSLKINGNAVFNEITPARFGKPYIHDTDVKAGEEITLEIKWLSLRSDNYKILTEV